MLVIRGCRQIVQTGSAAGDTISTLLTAGGASRWTLCIGGGRCLPRMSFT